MERGDQSCPSNGSGLDGKSVVMHTYIYIYREREREREQEKYPRIASGREGGTLNSKGWRPRQKNKNDVYF